ncbi:c-type cytochrome [Sphingopyxis sp.]|uniref:c-type cytochrome n=1 Tax=Sphingopyxis sp. TaxID=1908224 RepID=UPI003D0C7FE9
MRQLWAFLIVTLSLTGCDKVATAPDSEPPAAFARLSADPVDHGARVASVLGCTGCHGDNLAGQDWSDPEFAAMWTSNLSRLVPAMTDAQLTAVITGGKRPDGSVLWGMPSHLFTQLAAEDMASLLSFLRSKPPVGEMHPRPVFKALGQKEIAEGLFKSSPVDVAEQGGLWPPDVGANHALGRYIARATCAECHTMSLRGGTPYPGAERRPDLRIAAAYDGAAFNRMLHTGIAPGERKLKLMGEVARGRFKHFSDTEIAALFGYLRAVAAKDP